MESLRTSKSIAQSELQQLKETLRRLSAADDPTTSLKLSSLVTPATLTPTTPKATLRHAPTTPTGASNSKAVLSALKALQDKIRRVEDERATLEDECANLRAQIRLNEGQHVAATKKAAYELEQVKDAARAAYEALRAERDALQSDVIQAQHDHAITKNELEHVQDMLSSYKEKHDALAEQNAMQDAHVLRLQTEVVEMSSTSKSRVHELQEALMEATRSNKDAMRQIATLEDQVQRTTSHNTTLESRVQEAERTIAQVSQLNEKLVVRMWEAQAKAKVKPKAPKPPPPPAVNRSTAASRASAAAASHRGLSAGTLGVKGASTALGGRTQAQAAARTPPPPRKKSVKKLKPTKAKTNLERLEEANMAKVPFLLGTATTPSFSVIGTAQEALRASELYSAVAPDVHRQPSIDAVSPPPPPVATDHAKGPSTYKTGAPTELQIDEPPVSKVAFLNSMSKAIDSVQDEFTQLNERYKAIMGGLDKSPDVTKRMEETIDALEAKGEQLALLRQLHAQAAKNALSSATRRVVHSPDAARKKTKALRVLQEYRELERHMKDRTADG
ncbi:hypothetical protein SPRG_01742 [Saprolegnia parasitica CBS 223.65]|uniref:Cep57 centrosome localisation domain-containing protein n=1 Tax=Saprolegnia parasitica (strain CBS 223.65) TaxID=695850 RepID=A0A067CTN1_SAPPC|nr:hypothetical protein SPRG_01742 [Saprolegnia parasitica CBS 223.65]KDO33863.1 hypothetical protein SPRG_01742 [Saprolegnia parasitica CBS 223.65]|eukprot:XP_012195499.1 hypothetical protein SPRG_01742 [Saprolegnia parasitica CBS 223.65]